MDQAANSPTKKPSRMAIGGVTTAAAIAVAAAMMRNGLGAARRSMHSAHVVSATSAATSS